MNSQSLFSHPFLGWRSFSGEPVRICGWNLSHKTRGLELLYSENCVILTSYSFWLIHLCDRRTDGRAIAYGALCCRAPKIILFVPFGDYTYSLTYILTCSSDVYKLQSTYTTPSYLRDSITERVCSCWTLRPSVIQLLIQTFTGTDFPDALSGSQHRLSGLELAATDSSD